MPVSLSCDCGKKLKVKDELAGKKIRCPGCSDVLIVPAGVSRGSDLAKQAIRAVPPPLRRRADPDDDDDDDLPRRRPSRPPEAPPLHRERRRERDLDDDDDLDDVPRKKKRKKPKPRRSSGGGGGGIAINPEIVSGLLMMVGAVVWFILGLSKGIIFFYPPVLFALGIAAIVRGFMGGG